MNDLDKRKVRAVLLAAGIKRTDIDWMVESCPSLGAVLTHYSRSYKPIAPVTLPPSDYYAGILAARQRVMVARFFGPDSQLAEATSMLTTEIAIFKDRLEQESSKSEAR